MSKPTPKPATLAAGMRLKRKMTEAEFAAALAHMRPPSKRIMDMGHADLVRGVTQSEIAQEHGVTKSTVSQASKRVWEGFLKSKGYREVTVVLPEVQVFVVRKWGRAAMDEINREHPRRRRAEGAEG